MYGSEDIAVGSSFVFCTLNIESKEIFLPAFDCRVQKSIDPLYSALPAKYAVLFSNLTSIFSSDVSSFIPSN